MYIFLDIFKVNESRGVFRRKINKPCNRQSTYVLEHNRFSHVSAQIELGANFFVILDRFRPRRSRTFPLSCMHTNEKTSRTMTCCDANNTIIASHRKGSVFVCDRRAQTTQMQKVLRLVSIWFTLADAPDAVRER